MKVYFIYIIFHVFFVLLSLLSFYVSIKYDIENKYKIFELEINTLSDSLMNAVIENINIFNTLSSNIPIFDKMLFDNVSETYLNIFTDLIFVFPGSYSNDTKTKEFINDNSLLFESSLGRFRRNNSPDIIPIPRKQFPVCNFVIGLPIITESSIDSFLGISIDFNQFLRQTLINDFLRDGNEVQINIIRDNEIFRLFPGDNDICVECDYIVETSITDSLSITFSTRGESREYPWYTYVNSFFYYFYTICICYIYSKLIQSYKFANLKTSFMARISHEIRTPINAIIGTSELLENGNCEVSFLDTIKSSSKYLLELLNNILDISKIESREIEIAYNDFNLDIIKTIANDFWNTQSNNISFISVTYENIEPDSIVTGDNIKVKQILYNLLSNAIKFSNGGGIFIRVKLEYKEMIKNKILMTISIKDEGIGISESNLNNIFKPFHQIDYDGSGTGLGLTISKSFAVSMGGDLKCSSQLSKGTEFTFTSVVDGSISYNEENKFIYENKNTCTKNTIIDISDEKNNKSIDSSFNVLIVDDIYVNRLILRRILDSISVNSHECSSGEIAIEECNKNIYDIIFMDKFMPGIGGLNSIVQIRKDTLNKNSFIVLLTADVSEKSKQECVDHGGSYFMSKPITIESIKNVISIVKN